MAGETGKGVADTSVAKVVPILRRVTGSRTARAFFMRKTTANLMERLSNDEQDAMIQIAIGRRIVQSAIQDGRGSFRQFRYGEIYGKSMSGHNDFCVDLANRYIKWRSALESDDFTCDICLNICENETSINVLAAKKNKQWAFVFAAFRKGLAEWVSLRHPHLTANDNNIN